MSNTLKNVAESTASTLSDLVDEARSRIEDLPPLTRAARKRRNRKPWPLLIVVAVALVMLMAMKRRHAAATPQYDSAADRRS